MSQHTAIAVDLAKNVFEVAISQRPGVIAARHRLSRQRFLEFLTNHPPARIIFEACGSAHFWARQSLALGHQPVLLPPHLVRPYVKNRKTDRTDAAGLLEADRCADIQPVPIKTPAQQAIVALHRLRQAWMDTRTARLNLARAILREQGLTVPVGARHVLPALEPHLDDPDSPLPISLRPTLVCLVEEIRSLDHHITLAERQLEAVAADTPAVALLRSVPGIGLLTSTALVAAIGDPNRFRSSRHLASFLGLTPRERSSGERRRLGRIHKRGDSYVRMLLTNGARALLAARHPAKASQPLRDWATRVANRRGSNIATVALANKLARTAWAVWARLTPFAHPALTTAAA